MKKVFFTGSKGFLGSHLINGIKKNYPDYYIHEFNGQIEDYDSLEAEFKIHEWNIVIHFAGMSHVVDCEKQPQIAFEVNTLGTVFLCQLMGKYNFKGKIYFTSTAQVYEGAHNLEEVVYKNNTTIKPQNIYALSKYYSEGVLKNFSLVQDCEVNILRLFNHTHKSQSRKFMLPSVYNQIMEASDGDVIKVGNLNLERDFSLIEDFVVFFTSHISEKVEDKFNIINLSSGVPRRLIDLVTKLIQRSGKNLSIQVDENLLRKNDPKRILGVFETSYRTKLTDDEFIESFLKD